VIPRASPPRLGATARISATKLTEPCGTIHSGRIPHQQNLFRRQICQHAEIPNRRAGDRGAPRAALPECVVTGGKGTIPIAYKGQTYYVCCSGCKRAFDENPEKILAEYRERIAKRASDAK
jgi:YHS domain-containing protein